MNVIITRFKNILKFFYEFITRNILKSVFSTALIFMLLGIITSYLLKLTMNKDAWFWVFSSIPQTFASFVAILAVFLISRLELYKKDKEYILDLLLKRGLDAPIKIRLSSISSEKPKFNPESRIEWAKRVIERNPNYEDNWALERLINEFDALNNKTKKAKELMKRSLFFTSLIILSSIFLLPLGSVNVENSFLLKIFLDYPYLKWGVVYGIVGFCFADLYHIIFSLGQLLIEKD